MEKIAFLFPGQGAQYVGMGRDFYDNFTAAKDVFVEVDDLLHFNLSEVIFNGPLDLLSKTLYSQLGIFVNSVALLKVLKQEMNLIPDLCAGLSLGEYTALFACGYIDFKDNLFLIQKRAELMHEACKRCPGTMAAILGLEDSKVEDVLKNVKNVFCANYNCPYQIVISGSKEGIEEAMQLLKQNGAKCVLLKVEGAFHSPLMSCVKNELEEEINKVKLKDASIPLVMNVSGNVAASLQDIRCNLINQLNCSVRWKQSIEKMIELDVFSFLEIGCGRSLSSMNKKIGVKGAIFSLEKVEDLEKLKNIT